MLQKDPIPTDTLYLEDSVNSDMFTEKLQKISSPPKKIKKTFTKPIKRKGSTEKILNFETNNSSDEDTHDTRNISHTRIPRNIPKMTSLDYFGRYMVSLLRELPKNVSDQLQYDLLKQVLNAKIALQTTAYSVTVSDKPVTVTLNNDNVANITIHNENNTMVESVDSCNNEIQNGS